jgi:hypothetical protein
MKLIQNNICDLWLLGKTVCVTTNGYVKQNGSAVMGRGNAFAMKNIIPGLDEKLGEHIRQHGNNVGFIFHRVIAFPVKPAVGTFEQALPHVRDIYAGSVQVPGFHCQADLTIIERSAKQLAQLIRDKNISEVYLPVPGVGNGRLTKQQVIPVISGMLPDSVVLVEAL